MVSSKPWSTKKKVAVGVGATIGGFFVLMLGIGVYLVSTNPDLVQEVDSTGNEIQAQPAYSPNLDRIVGISEFGMLKQGSLYQAYFQLTDKDLNPIAADANVHLQVATTQMIYNSQTQQMDEINTVIYEQSLSVKEQEYENYVRKFTGADQGQMYLWLIDAQEIDSKVGTSAFALGKAMITVTLENGKSFSAETSTFF